ncbi:MAG: hypothetical protein MJZ12_00290 [Prevotella sp.]|nr:hypothetical protein [Prevotella sp.]
MQNSEFKKERDREVYATYLRGLREQCFEDLTQAAAWVQAQPASKFYISSKALVNYIFAIEKGSVPPKMYYLNELKVKVLYVRYMEYNLNHPNHGLSKEKICEMLVDEPAPQFYIDQDYIRRIIQRERIKRREELARRVNR